MQPAESPAAIERFWSTLLGYIREGQVIPIVGQDLITIEQEGRTVRLMDAVAAQLAAEIHGEGRFDGTPPCVGAADCDITTVIGRLRDPRDRLEFLARAHEILRSLCRAATVPRPLRQLAEIEPLRLMVSTTVDGMLAQHVDDRMSDGLLPWQTPAWHPGAEPSLADLDKSGPFDAPVIFHLLGLSSATPATSAITDDDILEFVTALHDPLRRPPKLFDELKKRHLLLLGTGFPDWLARFFLRLLKGESFSLSARHTHEFVAETDAMAGSKLAFFLERFSQKTRLCPCGSAIGFVDELHRRWTASWPTGDEAKPDGVFISYSRQDLPSVERIAKRLELAGIPFWFDKRELQPGDPFWQVIERNIAVSGVFLPVLSQTTRQRTQAHTGERREIGFWREWLHALACLQPSAGGGLRSVIPVVVDADLTAHGDYVPEPFQQRNYAHAPGGDTEDGLIRAIKRQLRARDALATA